MNEATPSSHTAPRIVVHTEHPVAVHSPDHLYPWGTRYDNSTNLRFNEKIEALYPRTSVDCLSVLDVGCSGGGFVRSVLNRGGLAVGLEGSDYSLRHRRAEWRTIPEYLFTCDITKPFRVELEQASSANPLSFHVVTAWEVMEHIAEGDLPGLVANIRQHLRPNGLWIMSVAESDDILNGVNLHQTVKPREWWIHFFAQQGLVHLPHFVDYFNTQFVRGPKYGAPTSFHLVLSPAPDHAPAQPHAYWSQRLYDRWLGSRKQRKLARWICGPGG